MPCKRCYGEGAADQLRKKVLLMRVCKFETAPDQGQNNNIHWILDLENKRSKKFRTFSPRFPSSFKHRRFCGKKRANVPVARMTANASLRVTNQPVNTVRPDRTQKTRKCNQKNDIRKAWKCTNKHKLEREIRRRGYVSFLFLVLFCLNLCCSFDTITTTNTYILQNGHETSDKNVLDGSFSVSICVALSIQSWQQTLTPYKTDTKRTTKTC